MPRVVMLSEVNPAVTVLVNHPLTQGRPRSCGSCAMTALYQAHNWFNLFNPDDLAALKARGSSRRSKRRSRWSTTAPASRARRCSSGTEPPLLHGRALSRPADLPTSTAGPDVQVPHRVRRVRPPPHRPVAQHPERPHAAATPDPHGYLEGYNRFAVEAVELGFVRHQDFTRDPDSEVHAMCAKLELPFDPTYRERWAAYAHITGDTKGTRAQTEIHPFLPRRPVEQSTIDEFAANPAYRAAIEMLGYSHP